MARIKIQSIELEYRPSINGIKVDDNPYDFDYDMLKLKLAEGKQPNVQYRKIRKEVSKDHQPRQAEGQAFEEAVEEDGSEDTEQAHKAHKQGKKGPHFKSVKKATKPKR